MVAGLSVSSGVAWVIGISWAFLFAQMRTRGSAVAKSGWQRIHPTKKVSSEHKAGKRAKFAPDLRVIARDLDQDTLNRRRRVLGEDHPDTLTAAASLASDLRALGQADDES